MIRYNTKTQKNNHLEKDRWQEKGGNGNVFQNLIKTVANKNS